MTVLEQRFMECATSYFAKQNNKKVDWEQRRYEIAKDTLMVLLNAPSQGEVQLTDLTSRAIAIADVFIEELKK